MTSIVNRAKILLADGAATPLVNGAATSFVDHTANLRSVGATPSLADGATTSLIDRAELRPHSSTD